MNLPRRRGGLRLALLGLVGALALPSAAHAATPTTERMSVSSDGAEADASSLDAQLSATGRYVVFASDATTLVANDDTGYRDIFIRDRREDTTRRVSLNSREKPGNGDSEWPSVSRDGRYVAFESDASNLVPGDDNDVSDIFVRDRQTGTTILVSRSTGGAIGNSTSYLAAISADGRVVAFASNASNLVKGDTNSQTDVFVRDLVRGTTTRVSRGAAQSDGDSYWPVLSADGRFVAFVSGATTLVAGDLNGVDDIYLRDRERGTTRRVSVASDGTEADARSSGPSISADGRVIAFDSFATNLVGGLDTNGWQDVFVRDRTAHTTTRVSMNTGLTIQGNGDSTAPSISADGRYVAFHSAANDLVGAFDTNGVVDVFRHDIELATTIIISVDMTGTVQGNLDSDYASISGDGRLVAFLSLANMLAGDDMNSSFDVFIRGPLA